MQTYENIHKNINDNKVGVKLSDKLLTPEEVAQKFSVTVNTVRDWLRNGELPGIKIGKIWRVREQELNAYIESKVRKGE